MNASARSPLVLLVDPDTRTRMALAEHLLPLGVTIVHAADGPAALAIVNASPVRLVVTELYLPTGDDECLIHAIRRDRRFTKTRTLAHTHRSLPSDREWAMRAGADAYLIKPTRAERLRYVVGRLATGRNGTAVPATSISAIVRRDSLDTALAEVEHGGLHGTSTIVFGRSWWENLPIAEQASFRRRARQVRISLRSDSMLGNHFVEVRGPSRGDPALSTERPESPYRR